MCGALATVCETEGCNNMVRYVLICYKCDDTKEVKRIFLRRGE
jgi:hypothetical protein